MHVLLLLLITTTMTKKNRIGEPGKQKKPSEKQVQCFYCSASMQRKALAKHITRFHNGQPVREKGTTSLFEFSQHTQKRRRIEPDNSRETKTTAPSPEANGHPNVDFTNATFGGIEYFPSSHRRQYSVFGGSYPIYFLAAGAKRRIRRFPSRQRRLRRRQPPKTAPRQLHNKSRFFAPWISYYTVLGKNSKTCKFTSIFLVGNWDRS